MACICCKLHRFLDSDNFTSYLNNEKFQDFCIFLQTSCHKRNRSLLPLENPNDMEVYIYLFGGVGTRYLTTVLGEFITFIPETKSSKMKWFPVIGVKKTSQTKSLTILGSAKLPIASLLLLSYYENNLKKHFEPINFDLASHMSTSTLIPCLLFLLQQTNDITLHETLMKKITSITLCDNSDHIKAFTTTTVSNSFANHSKTLTDHFDSHLTLYCKEEQKKTIEEITEEKWKNKLLTYLMTKNWTKTPCGCKNSYDNVQMETSTSQEYHQQQQRQQTTFPPLPPYPLLDSTPPPPPPPPPPQSQMMMMEMWNQIVPTQITSQEQEIQFAATTTERNPQMQWQHLK